MRVLIWGQMQNFQSGNSFMLSFATFIVLANMLLEIYFSSIGVFIWRYPDYVLKHKPFFLALFNAFLYY